MRKTSTIALYRTSIPFLLTLFEEVYKGEEERGLLPPPGEKSSPPNFGGGKERKKGEQRKEKKTRKPDWSAVRDQIIERGKKRGGREKEKRVGRQGRHERGEGELNAGIILIRTSKKRAKPFLEGVEPTIFHTSLLSSPSSLEEGKKKKRVAINFHFYLKKNTPGGFGLLFVFFGGEKGEKRKEEGGNAGPRRLACKSTFKGKKKEGEGSRNEPLNASLLKGEKKKGERKGKKRTWALGNSGGESTSPPKKGEERKGGFLFSSYLLASQPINH